MGFLNIFADAPRLLQPGVGMGSPSGLRNPSASASQLGITYIFFLWICSNFVFLLIRVLFQPGHL